MNKFRVNENKRTVRAYNEDIVSEEDFNQLERFRKLDYKVILVAKKPKEYNHIKKDMIVYLKENIDSKIYNDFIDGVEKDRNFLKLKWDLIHALQDEEKKKAEKEKREINKIDFETVKEIINQAKSKKSNLIENIIKQATTENEKADADADKSKSNKNESKQNENK